MSLTARESDLLLASGSFSRDAIKSTSYTDDYIVRGVNYVYLGSPTLVNGLNYFLFDPTPCNGNSTVFVQPFEIDVPEGPVQIDLFEGSEATGGTTLTIFNPNYSVGTSARKATFKQAPTIVDLGDIRYTFRLGGSGVPTSNYSASSSGSSPKIVDTTKKYMFRINNTTGGSLILNKVWYSWYEIPIT